MNSWLVHIFLKNQHKNNKKNAEPDRNLPLQKTEAQGIEWKYGRKDFVRALDFQLMSLVLKIEMLNKLKQKTWQKRVTSCGCDPRFLLLVLS